MGAYYGLNKSKKMYSLLLGIFVVLVLAMGITSNPVFGYLAIGVVGIYGVVPSVEKTWDLFG